MRFRASTAAWKKSTAPAERKSKKKITAKDVPEIYPIGSEVMVQVTKGPISNKGPRITTNISLAGRYLVLMPHSDQSGISRKIEDPKERERLRTILQRLDIPEGMGVIIRTIGEGQRARYFVRDLGLLIEQWRQIEDAFKTRAGTDRPVSGTRPRGPNSARFSNRRNKRCLL